MEKLSQHGCITRITIKRLFDNFDYVIPPEKTITLDRLLILYGDNGAGKTTILNLVFSLLYPFPKGGNKTRLARTPFSLLRVEFDDETCVEATKENGLLGSYRISLRTKTTEASFLLPVDEKLAVKGGDELFPALEKLNVAVYALPDDRRVKSTRVLEEKTDGEDSEYIYTQDSSTGLIQRTRRRRESHHLAVRPVMENLKSWIRERVFERSSIGEENTASIYLQIAKQLGGMTLPGNEMGHSNQPQLIQRIGQLTQRIAEFSRYGIPPSFPGEKFIEVINELPSYTVHPVARALEPYLNSLDARLDALDETKTLISTYVDTINSFLHNKEVTFSLQHGLRFTSGSNLIEPDWLSSGERQLVLLLSHTLLARDTGGIFLIDEPELSLNIKWQRQLVDALLRCSSGSRIQYILASHSIELISQYISNAVQLPTKQ